MPKQSLYYVVDENIIKLSVKYAIKEDSMSSSTVILNIKRNLDRMNFLFLRELEEMILNLLKETENMPEIVLEDWMELMNYIYLWKEVKRKKGSMANDIFL